MPSSPQPVAHRERGLARLVVLIGIGVVVAIIGIGAGIYFLVFPDDSPPPLELTPKASSATTTAASTGLAGTWGATDNGIAGYRIREKLGFLPAQSDAVGRTSEVTGGFTLTDGASGLQATDIAVEVDLTTLKSDDDRRDGRLRDQGLETAQFPTATFKSAGPIAVPDSARSGTEVTIDVRGDLTIHGVTKQVTIPIKARVDGDTIQLVGSLTFPLTDFAINKPSSPFVVSIEDDGTLEFQLFFTKQA
jgi:polyisoprenoid-binding protein YceI